MKKEDIKKEDLNEDFIEDAAGAIIREMQKEQGFDPNYIRAKANAIKCFLDLVCERYI